MKNLIAIIVAVGICTLTANAHSRTMKKCYEHFAEGRRSALLYLRDLEDVWHFVYEKEKESERISHSGAYDRLIYDADIDTLRQALERALNLMTKVFIMQHSAFRDFAEFDNCMEKNSDEKTD